MCPVPSADAEAAACAFCTLSRCSRADSGWVGGSRLRGAGVRYVVKSRASLGRGGRESCASCREVGSLGRSPGRAGWWWFSKARTFWFCTAEVEEECEEEGNDVEEDRFIAAPSPGGVFGSPLASCWVSLCTVGDRRCRFLCAAPRSAAGGMWGEEGGRDWAREWDGGKRPEEADAREGCGGLAGAVEEEGWLLCKVLIVTFDDGCCCVCWASFRSSRDDGKLTGFVDALLAWPWVTWLASWALAAADSRLLAGKDGGCGNLLWWLWRWLRNGPRARLGGPPAFSSKAGGPGAGASVRNLLEAFEERA